MSDKDKQKRLRTTMVIETANQGDFEWALSHAIELARFPCDPYGVFKEGRSVNSVQRPHGKGTKTNKGLAMPKTDKELPAVGQRVRLLENIWDDGQDHHPPGYLARRGEILIVRSLDPGHEYPVLISHEQITDQSFRVALSEIEVAE